MLECVTTSLPWTPSHADPLFIMAMDHRDSFGKTLFDVKNDQPTDDQLTRIRAAKRLIYEGVRQAHSRLSTGRAGVLVDEQYGDEVIARAQSDGVTLAVPIEASGQDWFTLAWGEQWIDHIRTIAPAYAKVLVRDNPDFAPGDRSAQLARLARASSALLGIGVPLLYELLVPATDAQLHSVSDDHDRYDRDVRPELVAQVIADNQAAGVEPRLWKVEGLDTVDAAHLVANAARSDGRDAELIVLGRDAPAERLDRWLQIAAQVPEFVGFAIGRSIWEDDLKQWAAGSADDDATAQAISTRYLDFAGQWHS